MDEFAVTGILKNIIAAGFIVGLFAIFWGTAWYLLQAWASSDEDDQGEE